MKVKDAVDCLKQAFKDDPDFAYSWHSNIAMMCYDAIGDTTLYDIGQQVNKHAVSNDAASRFMKLAFDAETGQEPATTHSSEIE